MSVQILQGDCREILKTLPDESVHCVVTSPPYFGLRDYGVDGQMGLEATPDEFIEELVSVFREVRRVLRSDGTCWLNIGDSYANDGKWGGSTGGKHASGLHGANGLGRQRTQTGLKPKDLMMMPARLALALQGDGWWIRSEIVWHKENPMPESAKDRPTSAHEKIFLLTKSARYFYDADAVRQPSNYDPTKAKMPDGWDTGPGAHGAIHRSGREKGRKADKQRGLTPRHQGHINHTTLDETPRGKGANLRNVWGFATSPFREAHFATFPPQLAERCIKAGCPEGGTVLDPFGGAGTTGLVADRLERNAILIELNPEYIDIAERRIHNDAPLFADVTTTGKPA